MRARLPPGQQHLPGGDHDRRHHHGGREQPELAGPGRADAERRDPGQHHRADVHQLREHRRLVHLHHHHRSAATPAANPNPLTFSNPVILPNATSTLTVNNNTTFGGLVTGVPLSTAVITLAGLGTVDFAQTNNFTNPITVNMVGASLTGVGGAFGTVIVGANNAFGVTGALTLTGGMLQSSVATGVTLSNPITLNASTFTFGGPAERAVREQSPDVHGPATLTGANTLDHSQCHADDHVRGPDDEYGLVDAGGAGHAQPDRQQHQLAAAVTIAGGTIVLSGPTGAFSGLTTANGITINTGGTLRIDNSGPAGNNNTNRIADVAPVALAGGTIQFLGNNSLATSETLGVLTLSNGQSSVALTTGVEHDEADLRLAGAGHRLERHGRLQHQSTPPPTSSAPTRTRSSSPTAPTHDQRHHPLGHWCSRAPGSSWRPYTAATGIINYSNTLVSPALTVQDFGRHPHRHRRGQPETLHLRRDLGAGQHDDQLADPGRAAPRSRSTRARP